MKDKFQTFKTNKAYMPMMDFRIESTSSSEIVPIYRVSLSFHSDVHVTDTQFLNESLENCECQIMHMLYEPFYSRVYELRNAIFAGDCRGAMEIINEIEKDFS